MSNQENNYSTPELRFPEFQKETPWKQEKIGTFATESRVKGSKGDVAKKLTVKLWGNGVFEKEEATKGSPNTQYYRRSAGQFIYSKLDFLNQGFGIVPKHLDGLESTVDLPCFDVKDAIDTRFLLEYVQRKDFYKTFGEIADGGRKAKRIQVNTFLNFPIFLPEINEQKKISDCLESVDRIIALQNKKLKLLKAQKKGLMQQLFPVGEAALPKTRFAEFQGEWKYFEVKDFAKVITGTRDTKNKVDNGQYPFYVRSQNVERIDSYSFDGEAVLTSGDGVGVGRNFHYIDGKFDFHQRVYCIHDFTDFVLGRFFYHYFSEHFYKRVMQLSAKNSVDSVRMAMISEMPVRLPCINEQQKIANCLTSAEQLINEQIEKIRELKNHKKALVQKLLPIVQGDIS